MSKEKMTKKMTSFSFFGGVFLFRSIQKVSLLELWVKFDGIKEISLECDTARMYSSD